MQVSRESYKIIMKNTAQNNFLLWLNKSNITELDIINCRKMQSASIVENENIFGITTISVCGFVNNDVVKLGTEIKQQYSESKKDFYERAFSILNICAQLMDSVNSIIIDEGAWTNQYFQNKFDEWKKERMDKLAD